MKLGQLEVEITADDTKLKRGLKSVDNQLGETAKRVGKLAAGFAKFAAVGVAAAAAVGVALVRSQLQQIDVLAKTSARLNITIQDLQGLRFAAEQSGASAGTLDRALERLTRNIGEVQGGTGEAKKAFDELGLSALELAKLSPSDALGKVATALQGVESNSQRVNFAYQILGRSGAQLVNMLANGEEGLNAFKQEALDLGLTLDEVDAAKVEAANDAMNRIQKVIQGGLQQATIELAPFIEDIANKFADAAKEAGGMGKVIVNVTEATGTAVAKLADFVGSISLGFKRISLVFAQIRMGLLELDVFINQAMNKTLSTIKKAINEIITQVNKIPTVEIELIDTAVTDNVELLSSSLDNATDSVTRLKQEIESIENAEPLGDRVTKWAEGVRASLEKPIVVKPTIEVDENLDDGPAERTGVNDAALEQLRQLGKDKLTLIQEQEDERLALLEVLDAEELLRIGGKEEAKNKIIADAEEQRAAVKEMAEEELNRIEQDAANKRIAIAELEKDMKEKANRDLFSNLSSLMNTGSKKLFKIGKAAAIANAVVTGYESAVEAYKGGLKVSGGNPVVGAAYAAASLAATGAQIASIKSQQIGGAGGGAGTFSGGQPAIRTQEQAQPAPSRNVSINLQGSNFSAEQVRTLIGQINEQIGDGVPVMIGAR